jgi:arginine N-succinyltransferase
MLRVRAAGPADFGEIKALLSQVGPGFTSLPRSDQALLERLELSERSYAGQVAASDGWYLLVAEELPSRRVLGIASVKAQVGIHDPHHSFRVIPAERGEEFHARGRDRRLLLLVTECCGYTEVGALFVAADARGLGVGKLLSRARYLLIALHPDLFAKTIMAELRGVFCGEGKSPFWQGLASLFVPMSFAEANALICDGRGAEVAAHFPKHPIDAVLVDDRARQAIGKVHSEGAFAASMLAAEGFGWGGLIDILDGGPTLTCSTADLRAVRAMRRVRAMVDALPEGTIRPMIANASLHKFAVTAAPIKPVGDSIAVNAEHIAALNCDGDREVALLWN